MPLETSAEGTQHPLSEDRVTSKMITNCGGDGGGGSIQINGTFKPYLRVSSCMLVSPDAMRSPALMGTVTVTVLGYSSQLFTLKIQQGT